MLQKNVLDAANEIKMLAYKKLARHYLADEPRKYDKDYFSISSIALNSTGDWIAIGCSHAGQLLVCEWQSETYAMKQQGHRTNMNCLAYSLDGQYIVTGGDEMKL